MMRSKEKSQKIYNNNCTSIIVKEHTGHHFYIEKIGCKKERKTLTKDTKVPLYFSGQDPKN